MKFLLLAIITSAVKVSPVEKVVELMIKLKEKTIADKAKEKQMFIKFDDYCHSQEDEKFWRAAKEAKKVDRLDSEIEEHDTKIEQNNLKIDELNGEIDKNKAQIADEIQAKNERRMADNEALKDLSTVISQCTRATEHLQKSDVSGTGFTQLANLLEATLKLRRPPNGLKNLTSQLELLQNDPNAGKPHAYKFHSTKVIEMLEDLNTQFKDQRVALDRESLKAQSDAEHSINALQNLMDSQVHKRDEFQGEVDDHTREREQKAQARAQTDKNLFANTDFAHHLVGCAQFQNVAEKNDAQNLLGYLPRHMEEVDGCPSDIGECGEKRNNYAARVKTRDEELGALTKAIELLQGEGGESYKANKRLVATQTQKKVNVKEEENKNDDEIEKLWEADRQLDLLNPSFLQLALAHPRSVHSKLTEFLMKMETETHATSFASVLLKVKLGDHFKSIRKMIQDMIEKLEKQVLAEQEQKEWCDEQMKKTKDGRQNAEGNILDASSSIDEETAKANQLQHEITELQKEIAADQKAKAEASDMRKEEKKDNDETVRDAREGLAAMKSAIEVLKEFYESNSGNSEEFELIQKPELLNGGEQSEIYRADGEGADGKTISDTRTESGNFDTKYDGNQAESKGIIGILEIIRSDYERTVDTISADEKAAAEEWKTNDERSATKTKKDQGTVDDKSDSKAAAEENVTSATNDLTSAEEDRKLRMDELAQLKPLCTATASADQLEERRKRRQQEIKGLREALEILREFK